VVRWGYQPDKAYWQALRAADVVVSTARHEFFGIGVVEAISAGCWPLLPDRLAYPEVTVDPRQENSCQVPLSGSGHG
jgi:glycosyltransferase involved in cell wall biosynthesis